MTQYPAKHPTATERRFTFAVPQLFQPAARKMQADGRVTAWLTLTVIDSVVLRRLMILVSDLVAQGVTDLVLDCAAVAVDDVTEPGLGLLVKLANEIRDDPRTKGTLTLGLVSEELFHRLDRAGLTTRVAPLSVERAFPSTPTSLEAHG